MKIFFPSTEFDEAVAAVCHGTASEEQMQALNELLRCHPDARDEYILRVEIHSRLASEPDLFTSLTDGASQSKEELFGTRYLAEHLPFPSAGHSRNRKLRWVAALAASVTLIATGLWGLQSWHPDGRTGATSEAVAMLNLAVDAQWDRQENLPRSGASLKPGWLRLQSGLAQVVFYSGARVAIEGPADLQIISPTEARLQKGRLTAEVPGQAQGFRISTPHMQMTDVGGVFGLEVKESETQLHVFRGSVRFQQDNAEVEKQLVAGTGAVVEQDGSQRLISANQAAFSSLSDLGTKYVAAEALRLDQWREASERLNDDPSLVVHLDFENDGSSSWRLLNKGRSFLVPDACIVGCQGTSGRWQEKHALEFQSGNDRVRLSVPGEFEALTFSTWVRVHGLDRQINSLFMSDGFSPGTVHWSVRDDGVLGLTVIGPGSYNFEIATSPPVLTLDQFGMWLHLAVVIDGNAKEVTQYVNGRSVSKQSIQIAPPYLIEQAELGNWNAQGFPGKDPFLIRNFSGAMDEFCLFSRALKDDEVRALYVAGRPQLEPLAKR